MSVSALRKDGGGVGAVAAYFDDVFGRGGPDVLSKTRVSSGYHVGATKVQESSSVHVGADLPQGCDFSVKLTPGEFMTDLNPLPVSPEVWAARQQPLSPGNIKLRQRMLGELRRLATVSRPDTCDCLAMIASRAHSSQSSDVYRINDMGAAVQVRRNCPSLLTTVY